MTMMMMPTAMTKTTIMSHNDDDVDDYESEDDPDDADDDDDNADNNDVWDLRNEAGQQRHNTNKHCKDAVQRRHEHTKNDIRR